MPIKDFSTFLSKITKYNRVSLGFGRSIARPCSCPQTNLSGDVLEMSVVRGVGGVCDMCMCLACGGVEGVGGYLCVLGDICVCCESGFFILLMAGPGICVLC